MAKATVQKGRCASCGDDISVPDNYADGDYVKCGSCSAQHKISREAGGIRLLLMDLTPLKEAQRENQKIVATIEAELAKARASFGIGANGLGLGVLYMVAQIGLEDQLLSQSLVVKAVGIAVASGVALELANFLFLAKRKVMGRLLAELADANAEGKRIQQKIREAVRR